MSSTSEGAPPRPVDEGLFADVRGEPQRLTFRGADRANPALLILSGPGAAFSRLAPFFTPWERAFTLVQWDQPGAGATWARNGDAALSLGRLAADAAAVAEIALARLGQRKLIVLGVSGGSIAGLMLAKARPDLVSAFVGTGQIVHWPRQQALGYRLALKAAQARGDAATVASLEHIGPPPYGALADELAFSQCANALTPAEQAEFATLDPGVAAALATPPADASWVPSSLTLPDQRARALAAFVAMKDEIARFDARALGPDYDVPLHFLQGEHDHYTPGAEVEAFAETARAPAVRFAELQGGGHSALFLRGSFLASLVSDVFPNIQSFV